MIGRALRLAPTNPEARQAESMLKNGQLLPKPLHRQGATATLQVAKVKQLEPSKSADTGLDPIAEARKQAIARLAQVLFDLSEEAGSSSIAASKRGMQAIVHDNGQLSEPSQIMQHISQAIDAQTREQDNQAIEELEKALATGFIEPALYFDAWKAPCKPCKLRSNIRITSSGAVC
jgi:hypothetical protein